MNSLLKRIKNQENFQPLFRYRKQTIGMKMIRKSYMTSPSPHPPFRKGGMGGFEKDRFHGHLLSNWLTVCSKLVKMKLFF